MPIVTLAYLLVLCLALCEFLTKGLAAQREGIVTRTGIQTVRNNLTAVRAEITSLTHVDIAARQRQADRILPSKPGPGWPGPGWPTSDPRGAGR